MEGVYPANESRLDTNTLGFDGKYSVLEGHQD